MGSRVADIASSPGLVDYSLTYAKAKSASWEHTVVRISDRKDLPKRPYQDFLGRLKEHQLLKFRVIQKQTWKCPSLSILQEQVSYSPVDLGQTPL